MFLKLIKDKSIVFVGPSATLIGQKQKDFINSFDVVVKPNGLGFIGEELYDDYGDRCDILYVNQSFLDHGSMDKKHLLKIGVKMICAKAMNKIKHIDLSPIHIRVMIRLKDRDSFARSPIMGSILLNDILSAKPKRIHLMGMDFYKNKKKYVPTYQPESVEKIIKNRKAGLFPPKSVHKVNDDFLYIYNKFKNNKNITVDDTIKKLFEEYEQRDTEI